MRDRPEISPGGRGGLEFGTLLLPPSCRTRKTLQVLILRSGAKSTTFRRNLISFSRNTKRKLCPSDSVLPVAIAPRYCRFASRNARGACF